MTELPSEPPGARRREPLARYTSLKVGGQADFFALVRTVPEASAVLGFANEHGLPCHWLGGGSNLLIADDGVEGLVARFMGDELVAPSGEQSFVVSGAGRSFSGLARLLARNGWTGLEWAANVPGSVGGAVVNNAGAFGSSVSERLLWTELAYGDGTVERLTADELCYSYRTSRLKRGEAKGAVVIRAAFQVQSAPSGECVARVRELERRRTASQPRQHSAGSVFANPTEDYAGRLIEAAGLKGLRVGGAEISEHHANFIVNLGGATANDVFALMVEAQQEVWRRFAVWLRPEIELLGRWKRDQLARLQPTAEESSPR